MLSKLSLSAIGLGATFVFSTTYGKHKQTYREYDSVGPPHEGKHQGLMQILWDISTSLPTVFASDSVNQEDIMPDQLLQSQKDDSSPYTLENLQIIFRHGARTPLSQLPMLEEACYDDNFLVRVPSHTRVPYKIEDIHTGGSRPVSNIDKRYTERHLKGGCHVGTLTSQGREQVYLLGIRLRKRYVEEMQFLPAQFDSQQISLRSTNINRAIDSLECFLAGLYQRDGITPNDIPLVRVSSNNKEYMYPTGRYCKSFRHVAANSFTCLKGNEDHDKIQNTYRKYTGYEDATPIDVVKIRDHAFSRKAHGLFLPKWMDDSMDTLDKLSARVLRQYVCGEPGLNNSVLMVTAGRLLYDLKQNMDSVVQKSPKAKKLCVYSGHDSTVYPVLAALGIFEERWPPYAADICFELYKDNADNHHVKVSYCNKYLHLGPESKEMISLEEFNSIITPYLSTPEMYRQRCDDLDLWKQQGSTQNE